MRLHEYQSKNIFRKYNISTPRGRVAAMSMEAKQIAEELGCRVIIKSQVLIGGRGKAGGIRLAKTPKEADEVAAQLLGMDLKGLPVRRVLVEEAIDFTREIYLGITNDRTACRPVIIASAAGGMDIEQVAANSPERIQKIYIDPLLGLRDYQTRDIAVSIDLPHELWRSFMVIARGLWNAYSEMDATLAEINPIVITEDKRLSALDGKMIIDDNALFRQPDLAEMRDLDVEDPMEIEARKFGLVYINLDGDIGCMVNGAGLAMTTMDIIQLLGGKPANFLDIGGGASAEKVSAALRLLLSTPRVKSILINIFGGITRCDEVARGLLAALGEANPQVPLVVRLVGTNAQVGLAMLKNANLNTADSLVDAAKLAMTYSGGKK